MDAEDNDTQRRRRGSGRTAHRRAFIVVVFMIAVIPVTGVSLLSPAHLDATLAMVTALLAAVSAVSGGPRA